MKILNNKMHGFLDYLTVVAFALAPFILSLEGIPQLLCYALAGVHLTMTLLTDFELGVAKIVPIKIHKIVEMIVGPVLIALPWILNFSGDAVAKMFFIAAGVVLIVVGQISQYSAKK